MEKKKEYLSKEEIERFLNDLSKELQNLTLTYLARPEVKSQSIKQ